MKMDSHGIDWVLDRSVRHRNVYRREGEQSFCSALGVVTFVEREVGIIQNADTSLIIDHRARKKPRSIQLESMSPLGFFSICLRAVPLDKTVDFYKALGFEPTGEDAPGLRVSLKHGNDTLTFMSFLDDNLINFRGAHIHNLKQELLGRGVKVKVFEELRDKEQLMLDDHGKPLPENECGHFSVYDLDGNDLFFNTHPEERAPFEEAVLSPPPLVKDAIPEHGMLGRLTYCLVVVNLLASMKFYELLGMHVIREKDKAWIFPPDSHGDTQFLFQLEQGQKKDVVVRFYQHSPDRVGLKGLGFKERSGERLGWEIYDPDGRAVEVISTSDERLLPSSGTS